MDAVRETFRVYPFRETGSRRATRICTKDSKWYRSSSPDCRQRGRPDPLKADLVRRRTTRVRPFRESPIVWRGRNLLSGFELICIAPIYPSARSYHRPMRIFRWSVPPLLAGRKLLSNARRSLFVDKLFRGWTLSWTKVTLTVSAENYCSSLSWQ